MGTKDHLSWKIGGEAGFGIMAAGEMFGRALVRSGLYVFGTTEYPSLIRGGHNTYHVRAEPKPVFTHIRPIDILVALNQETIDIHTGELWPGGVIIYDPDQLKDEEKKVARDDVKLVPVPLQKMASELGNPVLRNTVAIGASLGLFDHPPDCILGIIKEMFERKGSKIVKLNVDAIHSGIEYVKKRFPDPLVHEVVHECAKDKMYLTGNDAVCLGAIKAGLGFFAGYPMSPASSILHTLAAVAPKQGFIVHQTEDEISAINMAIGAAHAGARAMTASSGGGFSLMVEGLGLAGCTETPLVVVETQRPGPSTGIPTFTEQGDLRFVMHASQGDFPRVVVAPADAEECFFLTAQAHNIAEQYQLPVLVLIDKFISTSHFTYAKFDEGKIKVERGKLLDKAPADYKRYELTDDGVSSRVVPGMEGGVFQTTGNEHTEKGNISDNAENRVAMMQKRFRKLDRLGSRLFAPVMHGPKDADVTIVGWGSPKHAIVEALHLLQEKHGVKANFIQIVYVLPFPVEALKKQLGEAKRLVMVENNFSAQMRGVIREYTGVYIEDALVKYDGRALYPEEIVEFVVGLK